MLEERKGIDCVLYVQYKPRKGDAVLFHSMYPNGTFDKHALHGGCPVVKGEKIVMTRCHETPSRTQYASVSLCRLPCENGFLMHD